MGSDTLQYWANVAQLASLFIAILAFVLQIITWGKPTRPSIMPFLRWLRPAFPYIFVASLFFWLGTQVSRFSAAEISPSTPTASAPALDLPARPSSTSSQIAMTNTAIADSGCSRREDAEPSPNNTAGIFVMTDTLTQGSWSGKYGKEGYYMPNKPDDSVYMKEPADVNVTPQLPGGGSREAGIYNWAESTGDCSALQKGQGVKERFAQALTSGEPITVILDIPEGKTYQVAVYCVDWGTTNQREQTIEIWQGEKLLDSRSISNFTQGQYLIWNVTGSVVIRVKHTKGPNAVLSGIFFDLPGTTQ